MENMKNALAACFSLSAAFLVLFAPFAASAYNAPKPGERARLVLESLDARRGPVYLKYRTDGSEDGESVTVVFAAAGGKAYTDMSSEGWRISTIYDDKTKNVTIISHDTKNYVVANDGPIVMPLEDSLSRASGEGGGQFSSTSGTEKINGARYDYDRLVWEDGAVETFYFTPMTDSLKWWRVNDDLAEVLEYGSRNLDASFFKIPAGYKETKLPM